MDTKSTEYTSEKAEALIRDAQKELYRADEDVVPQLIYNNVQKAMTIYFQQFLSRKLGVNAADGTFKDLAAKCAEIDDRFKELDIHLIPGESDSIRTYIDMSNLEKCIKMAEKTGDIMTSTWPVSKHIK